MKSRGHRICHGSVFTGQAVRNMMDGPYVIDAVLGIASLGGKAILLMPLLPAAEIKAQIITPHPAVGAVSAPKMGLGRHHIPWFKISHAASHGFHNAGALMARYKRHVSGQAVLQALSRQKGRV